MKYKPFLLKSKDSNHYTLIHLDTVNIKNMPPIYDSLGMVATTKNSPIKKIYLKKNQAIYD
ncbi:MAG: hypothetical protein SP4CHLAM5_10190 [Chlamydiia bacterium]|nr:hypothetical protein [Chlamydiia bacterium]MCH9618876.1 hypothetical protein [Chlamydiia bacterium]MCH9623963.1 hypothetical protein [Chlamydiia bacterium]